MTPTTMNATREKKNFASEFRHGIVAVFHHILASILIVLIGAIAFSVGFAKSEHFEDVTNWPIWLATIGAIVSLLFGINLVRLVIRWLSRKQIRPGSGDAIALMIASIEGDSDANSLRETIREGIKAELGGRVEIIVWPQVLRLPEGHDEDAEHNPSNATSCIRLCRVNYGAPNWIALKF